MRLFLPSGIMLSWSHSGRERRGGKEGEAAASDAEEKNKAPVRRFLEARVKTELDPLDKMLAPDFVSHTPAPGQHLDRESYMRQVAESAGPFPGVGVVIEDPVAAEDRVVSRISGRGPHEGSDLRGPTPPAREMPPIAVFTPPLSEGKLSEE